MKTLKRKTSTEDLNFSDKFPKASLKLRNKPFEMKYKQKEGAYTFRYNTMQNHFILKVSGRQEVKPDAILKCV